MPASPLDFTPKVLLVDDDPQLLRSLESLLCRRFEVVAISDPRLALEHLRRHPIDVIISDQRMPGMSGTQLLEEARRHSPHAMRILLTGYADQRATIDSINQGEVFRYLEKPWDQRKLLQTVEEAAFAAHASRQIAAHPSQAPPAHQPGILVLDDDETVYDFIRVGVRRRIGEACPVAWSSNLEEALEHLNIGPANILICDVRLGDHDLAPFIKTLKRLRPDLLTLVATRFRDNRQLVELINQGQIYRFLAKPLVLGKLLSAIEAALARHQELTTNRNQLLRHSVQPPSPRPLEWRLEQWMGEHLRPVQALN